MHRSMEKYNKGRKIVEYLFKKKKKSEDRVVGGTQTCGTSPQRGRSLD